jgi:YrbI family 3-deoxy-D-manno-octulosonate 8-phosphate phosphatase
MKGQIVPDFSNIEVVATDVDGVLTDNNMYYFNSGEEAKRFNFYDGMAVELLKSWGVRVVFITQESTEIVKQRAKKLDVKVFQGIKDKGAVLVQVMKEENIHCHQIAYIGNDINDLSALRNAGIAICPADAMDSVKKVCQVVTNAKGGEGVLREVYERFIATRRR